LIGDASTAIEPSDQSAFDAATPVLRAPNRNSRGAQTFGCERDSSR
jgi:hypothetical protein